MTTLRVVCVLFGPGGNRKRRRRRGGKESANLVKCECISLDILVPSERKMVEIVLAYAHVT